MNKDNMNIVSCGDKIIATLECNGRRLASINGTHFSSLEDVKRALVTLAGRYVGMAVLTIRNCTRGWRDVTALATLRRPVLSMQSVVSTDSTPHFGAQYLIPWGA